MSQNLSPVTQAATRHFDAQGRQEIAVPEWTEEGAEPLILYASPMTLRQGQRLLRAIQNEGQLPAMVECLIMKAELADGKPAFSVLDKEALLTRVDQNVIRRVADRIMAGAPMPAPLSNDEAASELLERETARQAGN